MSDMKTCYNCGKTFPIEQYKEGEICPGEDCWYDHRDTKKEDIPHDYEERAYSLYRAGYGRRYEEDEPKLMYRCLEEIDERMLILFLTEPMRERDSYYIICNRLDHGDGGYWEREDEVARRNWQLLGCQDERISCSSGSLMKLMVKLLRERWES